MKMIILEKPYVSDFLIETIKKNNYSVFDNETARQYFKKEKLSSKTELDNADLIYSNSENAIGSIDNKSIKNLITLSKDKALFREKLKPIFPDYFFKKLTLDELKKFDKSKLKFPLVLKPNIGFLSFGVYPIYTLNDWDSVLENLDKDIKKFENIFPKNVVNASEFLIEQMITGEEFAIDAYFDENSKATILNIFQHPFFDKNDVSDRIYYTNKKIIKQYLAKFEELLNKIGDLCNYKNFPFHLELRVDNDKIIPIELNPLRFCGWCITDIAYFAYGINVYEYFFNNKKPDWNTILKNTPDDYFYFTIGEVPKMQEEIKEINYKKFLDNIKTPLCIRKIDFKKNPVFAIVFAKTKSTDEMKNLLKLNTKEFVIA